MGSAHYATAVLVRPACAVLFLHRQRFCGRSGSRRTKCRYVVPGMGGESPNGSALRLLHIATRHLIESVRQDVRRIGRARVDGATSGRSRLPVGLDGFSLVAVSWDDESTSVLRGPDFLGESAGVHASPSQVLPQLSLPQERAVPAGRHDSHSRGQRLESSSADHPSDNGSYISALID
jgi:hypothetical protein